MLNPAVNQRAIKILPNARGWKNVVAKFKNVHVNEMAMWPKRSVLLIIDFDHQAAIRLKCIRRLIPDDLNDRVFILGSLSEPEDIKTNLQMSFESVGRSLAQDCVDDTRTVWGHDLLKHNETELDRMIPFIKPFLFNLIEA